MNNKISRFLAKGIELKFVRNIQEIRQLPQVMFVLTKIRLPFKILAFCFEHAKQWLLEQGYEIHKIEYHIDCIEDFNFCLNLYIDCLGDNKNWDKFMALQNKFIKYCIDFEEKYHIETEYGMPFDLSDICEIADENVA